MKTKAHERRAIPKSNRLAKVFFLWNPNHFFDFRMGWNTVKDAGPILMVRVTRVTLSVVKDLGVESTRTKKVNRTNSVGLCGRKSATDLCFVLSGWKYDGEWKNDR
jgi:hypothetical protein